MDWRTHVRDLVYNWLLGDRPPGSLGDALLVPLGNADRVGAAALSILGTPRQEGVFYVGEVDGRQLAMCSPRLGGPAAAMYLEAAALAGVRRVVAFGYTGGLRPEAAVGTAFVAREALGLDGTTLAYGRGTAVAPGLLAGLPDASRTGPAGAPAPADTDARGVRPIATNTWETQPGGTTGDVARVWPADDALSDRLAALLTADELPWTAGRMATLDAIMLEDDETIETLAASGCAALDMETATLYAVARRHGVRVSSVHLVSDNPFLRETNPAEVHRLSYGRVLALAARAVLDG